jgi:hypothetical protein
MDSEMSATMKEKYKVDSSVSICDVEMRVRPAASNCRHSGGCLWVCWSVPYSIYRIDLSVNA